MQEIISNYMFSVLIIRAIKAEERNNENEKETWTSNMQIVRQLLVAVLFSLG